MARKKKTVEPKYEVELVLGQRKTGMMLPKNTGNWFAFRVFADEEEIGVVEVGRGSIFWKPYRNRRYGTAFRRSWEDFATRMELRLK
ncbi:hypothetical protein KF840_02655 [bacterium]|nr:hypothetical protein [bacterium]